MTIRQTDVSYKKMKVNGIKPGNQLYMQRNKIKLKLLSWMLSLLMSSSTQVFKDLKTVIDTY